MSGKTDFEKEFVELKCPNCGAKVELKKAQIEEHFMKSKFGNSYTYIGISAKNDGAVCTHCGAEFERKKKIQVHGAEGATITVGGDWVGRDKIVTVLNSGSGAVAMGEGAVAAGAGGLAKGGKKKKSEDDDDEDDDDFAVVFNGKRIK